MKETKKQHEKAARTARREADAIIEDARRTAEAVFGELKEYVHRVKQDCYNVLDEKFIIDDLWKYYSLHIK